ncbi:hypothetical protein [Alcaligenes faecalis]|uniref:hypothetical protein n=1 Tax=Alcaligenes faecalis TaxID=511 RepID=UPI001EF0489E|nr:hypothetical protein [Alcaligenes faecalis]ULH06457.1 hypothetical protein MF263_17530 [Alcaligenes faecalis]
MKSPWFILTRRYGTDVVSPDAVALEDALRELLIEDNPEVSEPVYAEHGDLWLRMGKEDGSMFVLTLNRGGVATLVHWAQQDYEVELSTPIRREGLDMGQMLQLLHQLRAGDADGLRLALR